KAGLNLRGRKVFPRALADRMGRPMARSKGTGRMQFEPPPELAGSGHVFDRIQRLAKALFPGCDSQVTLVGEGGTWRSHDPNGELPQDAPGAWAVVKSGELLWLGDSREDPRFNQRPAVTKHGIRFYA